MPAIRRALIVCLFTVVVVSAQTRITPPPNSFTPAQDVELGREAAAQVERQLPIMHDDEVESYVAGVGHRLVAAIPPEVQHPEFEYSFHAVNVSEINAFALPGGPMFVNRGMIEAAHTEGEVAGVMAHELSHVVLRHGTAQQAKAQKYQIGEVAGAVLGAIIGGRVGSVISQGAQFGLGAAYLRFPREYERQADIEGTHIMARAGYDARDMANVFKTIEKTSGPGGPQWLSDHPNPGNRFEYITEEARMLRVENPVRDTRAFEQVQTHLHRLAPAPTTEQATKNAERRTATAGNVPPLSSDRVEPPSSRFTSYTEGNVFRVSVPSNWRELQSQSSVTFAPSGGYGQTNGGVVFTHGVEIGIARNETHDLQTATDELIESLARGNARMGRPSPYRRTSIGDRPGLTTTLSNESEASGAAETVQIYSTLMRNGNLLYAIGVAPANQFDAYQSIFQRVARSIEMLEAGR
jgi:beta-barrel assembly-enhancing protease